MTTKVKVYLKQDGNNPDIYDVDDIQDAREYAARIIKEGYIRSKNGELHYFPITEVHKVKIVYAAGEDVAGIEIKGE